MIVINAADRFRFAEMLTLPDSSVRENRDASVVVRHATVHDKPIAELAACSIFLALGYLS